MRSVLVFISREALSCFEKKLTRICASPVIGLSARESVNSPVQMR